MSSIGHSIMSQLRVLLKIVGEWCLGGLVISLKLSNAHNMNWAGSSENKAGVASSSQFGLHVLRHAVWLTTINVIKNRLKLMKYVITQKK